MKNTLQSHQSPEEVHKHFMFADIKRWQQEIEIVNVEMIFYRNLIESHLRDQNSWNINDYQDLFNGIKDVQDYNAGYQKRVLDFTSKLGQMGECDDLQCEHHFLNEHSTLKIELEVHFSTYKNFKKTVLSYLKTRYNY